jgi:flagellar motor switch protein FliM
MNLCFPTFALEEVIAQLNRRQLTAGMKTSSEKLRENEVVVQRQLAKTHLPVVAELGRAQITVRDLLEMKTGDIIKLNTRIDQELQLMIAGQRKLAVRPGTVNGKRAVRVMRKLVDQDIIEE